MECAMWRDMIRKKMYSIDYAHRLNRMGDVIRKSVRYTHGNIFPTVL